MPSFLRMGLLMVLGLCTMPKLEIAAQNNLCDASSNANYLPNGFEIDGPASGCGPFAVKLKDLTGYSSIKYDFYYQGQGASTLAGTPTTANTYFAEPEITTFTILQYGSKPDGSPFYSCKNVSVYPSAPKPIISFNSCNRNFISLNIPKDSTNILFDQFQIDWGDGSEVVNVNSIPYNGYKNYSVYSNEKNIKVIGFSSSNSSCTATLDSTINLIEGGNYSTISSIEVTDNLDSAVLSLEGAFDSYQLYKREITGVFTQGAPFDLVKPIDYKTQIGGQACFTTFRNAGCVEVAGEVCTIEITNSSHDDSGVKLEWQKHPVGIVNNIYNANSIVDSVVYTVVRKDTSGNVDLFPNVSSPFIDPIICAMSYSYTLYADVYGTIRGKGLNYRSKSHTQTVDFSDEANKPTEINNVYVTVKNNSPEVRFQDDSPWPLNREKYFLYTNKDSTNFYPIDTILMVTDFEAFFDANESPLCFKVAFGDECGNISKLSPEVCTIQLTHDDGPELHWSNSKPFNPDTTNTYTVYYEDSTGTQTPVDNGINLGILSFNPDVSGLNGTARYFIEAESSDGRISRSNYVDLPISTRIYIAEAFTPNGENPEFELKGDLLSLTSFDFKIYNRTGELVFETNDQFNFWNGRLNSNNNAPIGLYYYVLKAIDIHDELIQRKGHFWLLK